MFGYFDLQCCRVCLSSFLEDISLMGSTGYDGSWVGGRACQIGFNYFGIYTYVRRIEYVNLMRCGRWEKDGMRLAVVVF